MEPMNLRIGEKLKSIRMARTLSLDDTAALTGVSKPMLGQIERGQSVPTVTTLWKIAAGDAAARPGGQASGGQRETGYPLPGRHSPRLSELVRGQV